MPKKDLQYTLIVSAMLGFFLIPLVKTVPPFNSLSAIVVYSLIILVPLVSLVGMYVAYMIGKKIAIIWQLAKFALVGVLNTAIDFGILNFFIALTGITSGSNIIPMNAFAFSGAVVNSYFWNKKSAGFVIFFVVTAIGIAINSGVLYIVTTLIPHSIDNTLWANIGKVLATGLSTVWNFLGYRLIVFKKKD